MSPRCVSWAPSCCANLATGSLRPEMADVPIIWKPYDKEEMARMVAKALEEPAEIFGEE